MAKTTAKTDKVKTKAMVEEVLGRCPEARNSDAVLYEKVYDRFYGRQVLAGSARKFLRMLRDGKIADPDNLRRLRAKIQNDEGRFPPTDPTVRRRRGYNDGDGED